MPSDKSNSNNAWMVQRLNEAGLNGFEHNKAVAMFSHGTPIGNALRLLWQSLRGA